MRLIGLMICALLVVVASSEAKSSSQQEEQLRHQFRLPKLFDFARFKQLFEKHYNSGIEDLARQRLFLARAFSSMIAAVGYRYRKENSYLKLNYMADWTSEELSKRRNKVMSQSVAGKVEEQSTPEVADEAEIGRKLEQISQQRQELGLSELADELDKAMHSRRRRSTTGDEQSDDGDDEQPLRDLSLDDLIAAPEKQTSQLDGEALDEPSNNPDYEAPELLSQGVEDSAQRDSSMDTTLAQYLAGLKGDKYLDSEIQKASKAFGKGRRRSNRIKEQVKRREPDEVFADLRETGCLGEARNQGFCGSCYIFSTTAMYEYKYCMERGRYVAFSEQFAIDCGARSELDGCDGGWENDVAEFVGKFGLELRSLYPYKEREDECPYGESTSPRVMGYIKIDEPGLETVELDQFEETLDEQHPILVIIWATDKFNMYGGGVDSMKNCLTKGEQHAVLIVGHGRQDGEEYWLIRNSYGSTWGENGYYKLNKKSECFSRDNQGLISRARFHARNKQYRQAPVKRQYREYKKELEEQHEKELKKSSKSKSG